MCQVVKVVGPRDGHRRPPPAACNAAYRRAVLHDKPAATRAREQADARRAACALVITHLFRSSIHAESTSLAIGTSLLPDPAAAAVRVEQQGRSAIEGRESESEEVARLLVWVEGKERRDGNGQAVCYRVHRPGRQGESFNKRTRLSHAHRPTVGAKRSLSLFSCCLFFLPVRSKHPLATRRGHSAGAHPHVAEWRVCQE